MSTSIVWLIRLRYLSPATSDLFESYISRTLLTYFAFFFVALLVSFLSYNSFVCFRNFLLNLLRFLVSPLKPAVELAEL